MKPHLSAECNRKVWRVNNHKELWTWNGHTYWILSSDISRGEHVKCSTFNNNS